ncbi:MAG: hypothetical protein H7A36_07130 [Chlamydiales bacterium]|nr:hypothetical protein [Chlamydiales bacterium]
MNYVYGGVRTYATEADAFSSLNTLACNQYCVLIIGNTPAFFALRTTAENVHLVAFRVIKQGIQNIQPIFFFMLVNRTIKVGFSSLVSFTVKRWLDLDDPNNPDSECPMGEILSDTIGVDYYNTRTLEIPENMA